MTDRVPRTGETAVRILLAAAAALALFLPSGMIHANGAVADPSCKPLPPVDLHLLPLTAASPGEVERFALEVAPRIPARWIRVRWIRSSDRLAWVAGDSLSTRPAGVLNRQEFQVSLRLPATGLETVHCLVEVMAESGQLWRRGVGVAVGPEAVRARGRLVSDGEGGQVLEFEAAPATQRVGGSR